jgi:hypothetical protein
MHADAGQLLYKLIDLGVVWVEGSFYESDVPHVRTAMAAAITIDALPGVTVHGRISSVYPIISGDSRTMRARVDVPNPGGRLKPGMFASMELTPTETQGLLVPADAVLDDGRQSFVVVAQGNGLFQPRPVTVAARGGDDALISDGLIGTEQVVARAAFLLDADSRLRTAMAGFDQPPVTSPADPAREQNDLRITVAPDPPIVGRNAVAVHLQTQNGVPVDDATVRVIGYMPPMPSMNMPATRSEAQLAHVGNGDYRGGLAFSMAGRWDLTVAALLANGSRAELRTSIVAR